MKTALRITGLFLFALAFASAEEVETYLRGGNMAFPAQALTSPRFSGEDYYWGGEVRLVQPIEPGIDLTLGLLRDPALGNLVYSGVSYRDNFFSLGAGPVYSFLNNDDLSLQPGVRADFSLQWPGRLLAQGEVMGSLGNRLRNPGDYSQFYNRFSLGLHLPNVLLRLEFSEKSALFLSDGGMEQETAVTDYGFVTEIFQKNIPYRVTLGFFYRQIKDIRTQTALSPVENQSQKLNALILQTRGEWDITPSFTLMADLLSGVFAFGTFDDYSAANSEVSLKLPSQFPQNYLFELSLGCRYRFTREE
ncbi:MAG: hypothetical protein LBQ61_09620 [Spirochaetales bacterium]|jgi:hypothetical protein|nr:hypothetical protein [Spirochaetales bacterium]